MRDFPIGVFDSGLGGISVLRALKARLHSEDFIYFADREHAPYGLKSDEEIISFTKSGVSDLISLGCKAIVIACNTATSVAVEHLRESVHIPLVGLEPAVKPAALSYPNGRILVLATPVTVSHAKYNELVKTLSHSGIVNVEAPELVRFVEMGLYCSSAVTEYLARLLSPYKGIRFDACVLGCTHFPFVKNSIITALGYQPDFFDGAEGAARRLETLLSVYGLNKLTERTAYVSFINKYASDIDRELLYSK